MTLYVGHDSCLGLSVNAVVFLKIGNTEASLNLGFDMVSLWNIFSVRVLYQHQCMPLKTGIAKLTGKI